MTFSCEIFSKKGSFLIFVRKNEISPLLYPWINSFGFPGKIHCWPSPEKNPFGAHGYSAVGVFAMHG